jgi:hypothetical protein
VDEAVARQAARLHVPDPRPVRDALIAATAQVHGMTVVTRNTDDFAPMGVPVFRIDSQLLVNQVRGARNHASILGVNPDRGQRSLCRSRPYHGKLHHRDARSRKISLKERAGSSSLRCNSSSLAGESAPA